MESSEASCAKRMGHVDHADKHYRHSLRKLQIELFRRTSHADAPWHLLRLDDKTIVPLELRRDLLPGSSYPGESPIFGAPDVEFVFPWPKDALLAP